MENLSFTAVAFDLFSISLQLLYYWSWSNLAFFFEDKGFLYACHLTHNESLSLALEKSQPRSLTSRSKSIPDFTLHRTCGLWDMESGGGGVTNSA